MDEKTKEAVWNKDNSNSDDLELIPVAQLSSTVNMEIEIPSKAGKLII